MDSLNPFYIKTFIFNYRFQDKNNQQNFLVQIFYIKELNKTDDLSKQFFLGEGIFNLKDTIKSDNQTTEIEIKNENMKKIENLGIINIKAVEREENYEFISVKFGIREIISKNPIAMKIHIKKHIEEWRPIYLTKTIQQKSKITFWEIVELPLSNLKSNVGETRIKYEMIEYLKNESTKILGELQMNVKDFFKAPPETQITLSRRVTNYLLIEEFESYNRFKFFDYLISDLNIKLFLFMDLTNSKLNKENFNFLNQKNNRKKNNKLSIINSSQKKENLQQNSAHLQPPCLPLQI